MDGPRGNYATSSKPDTEGQTLYDFTYMWNVKKTKKQTNKKKQVNKQNKTETDSQMPRTNCQRAGGLGGG